MGNLSKARKEIVDLLKEHGIKAIHYDEKNIIPMVAIVVPNDNYILPPSAKLRMKQWNVGLSILLIASKGTEERNVDELDDFIEKVVMLLARYVEVDITSVTGPAHVSLNGNSYLGSVVSIEYQFELEEIN